MRQLPQKILYALLLFAAVSCGNTGQKDTVTASTGNLPDSIIVGKKLFEATCVRCHGMDGSGLTGPSLKRPRLAHAPDLAGFIQTVELGIAGTGMPSNWAYSDSDCYHLYAYLGYLRNKGKETPTGDTAMGRVVFNTSGCLNCHMMNGQGVGIGPDLSEIGASRSPSNLRQSIVDPAAELPGSTDLDNGYGFSLYLPLKITTRDGKEITGLRINEDTYTIQLKDAANNYYSFNKDELKSVEKQYGTSLMPSFKKILSDQQIENLVAFLYKSGNE